MELALSGAKEILMARRPSLQVFSFGYDGWGNATEQLVRCVDAVERSRGFRPPLFVDVRIRREVRAVGFAGNAFGNLVGPRRYRWIKGLGNQGIITRQGPAIQILHPEAADDLFDFVLEAAQDDRRVIFYCSCRFPRHCHRWKVGSLLLKVAERRGRSLQVVEWPGGRPSEIAVPVDGRMISAISRGRMSIPLGERWNLATVAGLPWGSLATLQDDDQQLFRLVGPVRWQSGQWALPIAPSQPRDLNGAKQTFRAHQVRYRKSAGMEPRPG